MDIKVLMCGHYIQAELNGMTKIINEGETQLLTNVNELVQIRMTYLGKDKGIQVDKEAPLDSYEVVIPDELVRPPVMPKSFISAHGYNVNIRTEVNKIWVLITGDNETVVYDNGLTSEGLHLERHMSNCLGEVNTIIAQTLLSHGEQPNEIKTELDNRFTQCLQGLNDV